MNSSEISDYEVGLSAERPWGNWTVLAVGDGFAIKTISVNPGHILSLQSHRYRSEHWTILTGDAEVTVGDEIIQRTTDDSVFIPATAKHRIANVGNGVLTFIEIQTGSVLSEDDIERFDDRYGRHDLHRENSPK